METIIAPLTFKDLHKYTSTLQCAKSLKGVPDTTKYHNLGKIAHNTKGFCSQSQSHCNENLKFHQQLQNAFKNSLYGGSVLDGIQVVDPEAFDLRLIKNGLLNSIIDKRNCNAGFYKL